MAENQIVKVRMVDAGFDPAHGKMRKDGVYEFPREQAERYVRSGAAKPAPHSARLAKDEDRAALMKDERLRREIYERDAEMSAAWDVEVRATDVLEGNVADAEAALEAAEGRLEAAERAGKHRAAKSPEPGPVETQGPR